MGLNLKNSRYMIRYMHNPTRATSMESAYICIRLNTAAIRTMIPIGRNEQANAAISRILMSSSLVMYPILPFKVLKATKASKNLMTGTIKASYLL